MQKANDESKKRKAETEAPSGSNEKPNKSKWNYQSIEMFKILRTLQY